MTLHAQTVMIDKADAPEGYYPVPKDSVYNPENANCHMYPNICMACDWRPDCSGAHPCMSDNRADGISVVFKREGS
jgi:hypothetical protein